MNHFHRYDEIIHLPHPVSQTHPRMGRLERAAQFSPFAALTGYDDAVRETARLTDAQRELAEDEQALLERQLLRVQMLLDAGTPPVVAVTWFQPDAKKQGGAYVTAKGKVRKIDEFGGALLLVGGEKIPISAVIGIQLYNDKEQIEEGYVASHASDKLAQQVGSQAIINTMLNGILIGNMGLATTLSMISMVPSIFFAAFGAKYVGKKGSKKGIVTWTCVSMAITSVLILFFIFTDTRQIGVIGSWNMIVYVLLTLLQNGSNMCITTSNNSYMADTIDYELDRSGRYIPAVVSGTYSLIDKLITSVAAVIATGAVAILGYTTTMPQPTDAYTSGIFWMTLAIKYGLPMLGWVITLIAMPGCPLTKEEMVNVQKRIADKKDALRHEVIAEHMQ